ncbi:hypothetical protein GKC29_27680 [Micromonospora sp. WMMC415]|uniref:hypothetical protein n=1 Tax=Micromonospora sp. WMMC415 TaxID=2675222 RepID=UPI0012B46C34|nr:hypothetical protein [Micromonospora sp. WMMC415]QGN50227.1 hypothetical protein GKC29_27680 [Micromonospora sp. WMMC415]
MNIDAVRIKEGPAALQRPGPWPGRSPDMHNPTRRTLRAEVRAAAAGRPGWRLSAALPYGDAVEATFAVGPWRALILGNPRGWWWSLWRDGSPVRTLTTPEAGPDEVSAVAAIARVLAEIARGGAR